MKYSILTMAFVAGTTILSCTKDITPEPPVELNFEYEIEDLTHNSAVITISPSETEQTYFFSIMKKDSYDGYDAEKIFEMNMDEFRKSAQDNGVSLKSVILGALYTGDTHYKASGLESDTEYILYSYSLSPDGIHGKVLSEFQFQTEQLQIPEDSSSIKIEPEEIGGTVCKIRYIPSDQEMMYLAGIVSVSELEQYSGDNVLAEYIEDHIQKIASESGMDTQETLQMMQNCGEMTSEYHYLVPEEKYLAFAACFGESGEVSYASNIQFAMSEREMIDFTIKYEIRNITQTSFTVDVTVSDQEQAYFIECWPKYAIEECSSDEEIMQLVIDRYGSDKIELHKGNIKNSTIRSLQMNNEYVMIGFGFNETYVTGLFMEEVRTLPQVSPEDLKIEVRIDNKNSITANAVFLPEDGTVPFHFYYFTEEFLKEECTDVNDAIQKSFDTNISQWQSVYPELSREEIISMISRQGNRSYVAEYLVPETTYYMWAATFTKDGKLVSKEPSYTTFTTDKYPLNENIHTEAVSTKYFDGDVLSEDYQYHIYDGYIVAVIDTIKVSGAKTWYTLFFKGDLSSETDYPEHQLASNLLKKGSINKGKEPYDALMKGWGKWTLCSIGVDENGNYGPIQRTVFDFTREGANNPEEFFEYPNHSSAASTGNQFEMSAVMKELQ